MVLIISCLHKLYVFRSWKIHVLCILIPSRYITFFLDTTPIHRAYFLTFLFARYLCQSIEVFFDTFLNTSHRSSSSCMLFMCESCFAFFFLPFMSIAYCFHVFQVGLCFLVLLILFMPVFYLSPVMFFFGFLCPLTIMSKMGRNLSFECYSLGGVTDLGGELHVRGRRNFLM